MMAPSTLGTFLHAFTVSYVRQIDRLAGELMARAWAAGAGPGEEPVTIDLDSTVCEVSGDRKQGTGFGGAAREGRPAEPSRRPARPGSKASALQRPPGSPPR
jgi:hypothetical protein